MKFEEIWKNVGEFGPFQRILFLGCACFPALQFMSHAVWNYIGPDHPHWCRLKELHNFSEEEQKYIAIPYDDGSSVKYDQCRMFDLAWQNISQADLINWNRTKTMNATLVNCEEWNYDSSFKSTIRSEWDLVCDNSWVVDIIAMGYQVGLVMASVVSGFLSDRFGRRATVVLFVFGNVSVHATAAFAPNVIVYGVFRSLAGLTMRATTNVAFILGAEMCGSSARVLCASIVPAMIAFGTMLMVPSGYLLNHFRLIHMEMAILNACTLAYVFFLPESPRWLFSKGREEEARAVIRRVAMRNRSVAPLNGSHPENQIETKVKLVSFTCALTSRTLRLYLFIVFTGWLASNVVHQAITVTMSELSGVLHINLLLSASADLPACLLFYFIVRYIGRKPGFIATYLTASVATFLAIPFDTFIDVPLLATVCNILCKAALGASYLCMFVLSAELFPASIRSRAMGYTSGLASLFAISAPYIGGPLRDTWRPLPNLIYGVLTLLTGLLGFLLPETIDEKMPESLQDAENLGRKR